MAQSPFGGCLETEAWLVSARWKARTWRESLVLGIDVEMGFPKKNDERRRIFDILEKERLLHRGGCLSKSKSRQWSLDKSVLEVMYEKRIGEGLSAS
jgi:hypothetical protein